MKQEDGMDFKIPGLIGKYLREDISADERLVLDAWRDESAANKQLWNKLTDPSYVGGQLIKWDDTEVSGRMWKQLEQTIRSERKKTNGVGRYWLRAAALLLAVMAIGWLLYHKKENAHPAVIMPSAKLAKVTDSGMAAPPAVVKQGVVLMLGNGERVSLTASSQNKLQERDGTSIVNKDGSLEYAADNKTAEGELLMNRVVTPAGLTYQLSLADGTKVWLSAGSSIAYPTVFRGGARQVEMQGEAYFEVAADKSRPFFVITAKTRIEVLGTSFNIRSYADESFEKTSLLEGAVKVSSAHMREARVLKPGFEALTSNAGALQVNKANVSDAIAWKNGLLVFDNQTLESLMHNLTRWYGIQVTFADSALKNFHFTGRLQRYDRVNELLEIIGQTSKVKFELWQNRVLVKHLEN